MSSLCLSLSYIIGILLAMISILSFFRFKIVKKIPFLVYAALVAISAIFLFSAVYFVINETSLHSFLLSVHSTIRLFVADMDYQLIEDFINTSPNINLCVFRYYSIIIFILSPLLTFGYVLTFFKNISNSIKLRFSFNKTLYVFSEINEDSISLAKDLREKHPKCMLVFTDVFDENNELSYEAIRGIEQLDALYFKQDISVLKYPTKGKKINFIIVGEDENEKTSQVLQLCQRYKNDSNKEIFWFSSTIQSDLLLTSLDNGNLIVRRVNPEKSLIYQMLYKKGKKLFESAIKDDETKHIHAVLVGLGKHGMNMLKVLCWLCQMDGYSLTIDVFDQKEDCESRLKNQCPGLFSENEVSNFIHVHSGKKIENEEFIQFLNKIHPTYVFVALGDDELNVQASITVRRTYARLDLDPWIQAVVFNSDMIAPLRVIESGRQEPYHIDFIGDRDSNYSEEVLIGNDMVQQGLKIHTELYKSSEKSFWNYEYNFYSSIACALFNKVRDELDDSFSDLVQMEQRRWKNYMFTEGYVYQETRSDLAKTHSALVENYEQLNDVYKHINERIANQSDS